MSPVNS